MRRGILGALLFMIPGAAFCAEAVFASGEAQTALVELFTSEGCSSCPPAERWLADRRGDPSLWREFVPVAWHVTYWDELGWRDRWAQHVFTERQYAYAQLWRSETVYTPCFIRNGREWQAGRAGGGGEPAGILRARYEPRTGAVEIAFEPRAESIDRELAAHAALLGGGIVSRIRAGENRGRTLEQEFVALAVADAALVGRNGTRRAHLSLSMPAGPGIPRRALAVWVTRRGGLTPLQATGGWLEPPGPSDGTQVNQ
jgi:hypothetical protein